MRILLSVFLCFGFSSVAQSPDTKSIAGDENIASFISNVDCGEASLSSSLVGWIAQQYHVTSIVLMDLRSYSHGATYFKLEVGLAMPNSSDVTRTLKYSSCKISTAALK